MQYSSRDLTSHAKLKLRALGQSGPEEVQRRDLRAELLELEGKQLEPKETRSGGAVDDDTDILIARPFAKQLHDLDEDNVSEGDGVDDLVHEECQDDDDEDDTEALLRELEKIKQERETEKLKTLEEEERRRQEQSLGANPLIAHGSPSFTVKRRWDDDVVFKNQASSVVENPKKRFINDTLRSDFHRKFLDRYIK
jgi:protein CWC15